MMDRHPKAIGRADRFVRAMACYIEALDLRYPNGSAELRAELDCRAKVSVMPTTKKRDTAA
jgi:hypothetical protein